MCPQTPPTFTETLAPPFPQIFTLLNIFTVAIMHLFIPAIPPTPQFALFVFNVRLPPDTEQLNILLSLIPAIPPAAT